MVDGIYHAIQKFESRRRPVYLVKNNEGIYVAKKATKKEEETLRELSHPGIVKIIESGKVLKGNRELQGNYLILERISGTEMIDLDSPLPVPTVIGYARSITDVLNYLANQDMCHGDINPRNIIVDKNKVIFYDFEWVKKFDGKDFVRIRGATPNFAAPEVNFVHRIYRNSEVYSIGVLFYHCLHPEGFDIERRVGGTVRLALWLIPNAEEIYSGFLDATAEDPNYPLGEYDILNSIDIRKIPNHQLHREPKLVSLLESMLEVDQKNRPQINEVDKRLLEI